MCSSLPTPLRKWIIRTGIHLYDNLEPVYLRSVPWYQCSLQIVFRFCYQKHLQFVHLDILLLFWGDNFHYVEWSRVSFYIIIRNSLCELSHNKINSNGLEMRKVWGLKVVQIRELYTLEKLISNLYSIIYISETILFNPLKLYPHLFFYC